MPAIQRSEFALALNQVAAERGVDPSVVLETVKNAIVAAYRKDHPDTELEGYEATLDKNTGEAHILHNGTDVTPPGFGRIAAQTAKQVILQKIREKEKEAIISDYRIKIGQVVNGHVLRFAGPNIIIDIGKAEGVMPPQEQIAVEKYHLNQRLSVYLLEIREGLKGEEIIVSRSSNGLLEGLFRREVPEIAQGTVVIKAIAREAGTRAKIAVASTQPGIDAVGSCVGQKGVRVQAVIQEFNGLEKIDIIQWQDNVQLFIAQALSPAKDLTVVLNEGEKIANVAVVEEELPLAIGKDGQNVRLASKLTGYRIEITPKEGAKKEPEETPKNTTLEAKEQAEPAKTTEKDAAEENTKELAKDNDLTKKVSPKDEKNTPTDVESTGKKEADEQAA